MANTRPVVVTVTGTASAAGNNDFAFAGGTQLNKMWHLYSARAHDDGWGGGATALNPMVRTLLTTAANLRVIKGLGAVAPGADRAEIFTAYVMCHDPTDDIEVEQLHPDMAGQTILTFASSIADTGQNCVHPIYHGHTLDAATASTWAACAMRMKPGTAGGFFEIALERYDDAGGGEAAFLCEVEYLDWNNADIEARFLDVTTTGAVTDTVIGGGVDVLRTWSLFTFKLDEANADGVHLCDGKIIGGGATFRATQQTHTGTCVGTAVIVEDIGATPYWGVIAPLALDMAGGAATDTTAIGAAYDLTRSCIAPCSQVGAYGIGVCQAGDGVDMAAVEYEFADASNVGGQRTAATQAAQISNNVNAIQFAADGPDPGLVRHGRTAWMSDRMRRARQRWG